MKKLCILCLVPAISFANCDYENQTVSTIQGTIQSLEVTDRTVTEYFQETKKCKGIYPSMTLGTKLALKSDWLIFLGSDDWFNNKYSLEIIVNKIKSNGSTTGNIITIFNTQFLQDRTSKLLSNGTPECNKSANCIYT